MRGHWFFLVVVVIIGGYIWIENNKYTASGAAQYSSFTDYLLGRTPPA